MGLGETVFDVGASTIHNNQLRLIGWSVLFEKWLVWHPTSAPFAADAVPVLWFFSNGPLSAADIHKKMKALRRHRRL